jgi:hypothetical protein
MIKMCIKKLVPVLALLCVTKGFHLLEAVGFLKPSLYRHKTTGNSVFLLPYQEGNTTLVKRSKSQLRELKHFLHMLTSDLIPVRGLYKMTYLVYEDDNISDPLSFSSHVAILMHKIQGTPIACNLQSEDLSLDAIIKDFNKSPVALYIFNNTMFKHIESFLPDYQACSLSSGSKKETAPMYSLFHNLKKRTKSAPKKCYLSDCKKKGTVSCKQCHSSWLCSTECKCYQKHLSLCNEPLPGKQDKGDLKNTSHQIIIDNSRNQVAVGSIDSSNEDFKDFSKQLKKLGVNYTHTILSGDKQSGYYVQAVMERRSECVICKSTKSIKKCSRCRKVPYCSQACQKADWKEHKKVCKEVTTKEKSYVDITYLRCNACKELKPNSFYCPLCKSTPYCSQDCQKSDWSAHRVCCGTASSTEETHR